MHVSKIKLVTLAATMTVLCGCAAFRDQAAMDSEELLKSAGFAAQGPSARDWKPEYLKLVQRQIVAIRDDGDTTYVFADEDYCKCAYIGHSAEFKELQRLRKDRLEEHNWYTRQSWFEDGPSRYSGPWKPEGLELK
jgi:hypothetical protein